MTAGVDDPAQRTGLAWIRTMLGVVAVTLLVERGLWERSAPVGVLVVPLVPALAFLVVGAARRRVLAAAPPAGPSGWVVGGAVAGVCALAVAGLATVALA